MTHPNHITCLIVDDEPIGRERIARLLLGYAFIDLVGMCEDGIEAKEFLAKQDVQLMFVDIEMPRMDGLSLVQSLPPVRRPFIIFATAYDSFAVQAFDLFAIDYLLKPFSKDRFHQCMYKLLLHFRNQHFSQNQQLAGFFAAYHQLPSPSPEMSKRLAIKLGNRTYFIQIAQIEFISSSGNYLEVFADGKIHIIRDSMAYFLTTLPPHFIRIHKSSSVNIEFIQELVTTGYGDYSLLMESGKVLRMSDTYKKGVLEVLR